MSISAGFTTEEIREFVHQYEVQPYGQKAIWLEGQRVSYDRLRRWRSAVFDGDLDRGLIPREGGVVTVPPEKRTGIERQRARERAAQEAELARLKTRVRELEETNAALGKAIGLLHQMSEQEPAASRPATDPSGSSMPRTTSSDS
jgi:DNA-binding transcriptional MerR regulator